MTSFTYVKQERKTIPCKACCSADCGKAEAAAGCAALGGEARAVAAAAVAAELAERPRLMLEETEELLVRVEPPEAAL